ncbi:MULTISPECIES: RagB/SusD family nutrient uptake outer membrane protein [unclassified Carboxylicivirga]|uniref:RagB/SusD family nutrient uptake outer membrane protein n=1 Tax=Carboxylicivirga TaxID=1628153 RepID=UPI003D334FB0
MKKILYILSLVLIPAFWSCEDFLERDPLDFGSDEAYFNRVEDLAMFTTTFYKQLPGMSNWYGGLYNADNNSDNQSSHTPNINFYKGDKQTPLVKQSEWKFEVIRDINYFLAKIAEKRAAGKIMGTEILLDHYVGEAYFFRAYDYFRLLSTIGDVPILTEMLSNDFEGLVQASKRAPRNEVARFILSDLDKAIELMLDEAPETGRLCKDAARLMKGRVALYEATWLKYHQGTALAPGNAKWPGHAMYPDFQFLAGGIEAEYNWFFEQAYEAADAVAQARPLHDDYQEMFNRIKGLESIPEVILALYYEEGVVSHSATHYLSRTGAGTGLTKAFVENFLLSNGMPLYADSEGLYQGDLMVHDVLKNRDNRLVSSVKDAGFVMRQIEQNGELVNDTVVDYLPNIHVVGNQGTATGYEIKKWMSTEDGQDEAGAGTTDVPVFRAAEAYLIYLEAYYERHGALGGNCDTYWRALRNRAGVDEDYNATIAATILEQETDLATKSAGTYVSPTLYNIRRERRCEFVAEGFRYNDLKRWRALDHMVNYNIEGINLWEDMYQYYDPKDIQAGVVSQSGMGNYVQPLRLNASSPSYGGYTFPKAHYLEPIPVSEIIMTSPNGDVNSSTIYQNPGWPSKVAGIADYAVDLD